MFDQIKLPVCPVCGISCSECRVHRSAVGGYVKVVLRFACGAEHSQTTEEGGQCKHESLDRDALDAERQRHAEARADYTQRFNAAMEEKRKGYGTSV
jgi:hypothetical protein